MPLEKALDILAKAPLAGVLVKGAKLVAELGAGAITASKSIGIDR
jgi:hypothetical protein